MGVLRVAAGRRPLFPEVGQRAERRHVAHHPRAFRQVQMPQLGEVRPIGNVGSPLRELESPQLYMVDPRGVSPSDPGDHERQ